MILLYILIDPRDNEIRYVGKTVQKLHRRLSGHLLDARTAQNKRARWIAKLLRLGYLPRIELVQTVPESDWQSAEQYWIGYYRSLGCDLVNGTEGGDGGNRQTPEVRAKMSAIKKGITPQWRVGTTHSEATKQKIGQSNSGKSPSAETRSKMSVSHTGQKRTDEQRSHMGQAWLGRKHTEESKLKMSAAKKGRHNTHCLHGHEFTLENTKWEDGHQRCIACRRERRLARRS